MDAAAIDSSLKILESQISGVEHYVDGLERWLWLFSAAVVIGVAFEVFFLIHEYFEDKKNWRRGVIKSPDRPSRLLFSVEIAGIILVVLGVAGELGIGILSSSKNATLRTLNNSRLELVRQKATEAVAQAGDAKLSAQQASDATASAVSSAERAGAVANSVEKNAEALQASLEREIIDREQVAARLDPLVNFAYKFMYRLRGAPKSKATVWYDPAGGDRVFSLASTIRNLLASAEPSGANWDAPEPIPIPNGAGTHSGDIVIVHSSKIGIACSTNSPCGRLQSALSLSLQTGIFVAQSAELPEDAFLVIVKRIPEGSSAPFRTLPFSPAK